MKKLLLAVLGSVSLVGCGDFQVTADEQYYRSQKTYVYPNPDYNRSIDVEVYSTDRPHYRKYRHYYHK